MEVKVPVMKMNDGNTIPQFGFGVYCIEDHDECVKYVLEALKNGYRHIDTAQIYKNEQAVGEAIKKSGIPREEIYITTKVWIDNFGIDETKKSVEDSLKKLDLEYIDLVLLHYNLKDYTSAWKSLETLKEEGKIKSIGISNFEIKDIMKILDICKYKPVVNQIECNPYISQDKLRSFCHENDILVEAWGPLGHGNQKLINNSLIDKLSNKYNKTTVQIILRWHIQKNNIVFPKSIDEKHIKENIDIFDFNISEDDMKLIDNLNKNKSIYPLPSFTKKFVFPIIFKIQ